MTATTAHLDVDYVLGIHELPVECIEDCSAPGSVDEAVAYWREKLGMTVNPIRARKCLQGYGAWEADELAALDNVALSEKVLWLACCDFSEFMTECERRGVDPLDPPADFSPNCGSDIFVLE
jgi:hypothetical protein